MITRATSLFLAGLFSCLVSFGQWTEENLPSESSGLQASKSRFSELIQPVEKLHFSVSSGFSVQSGGSFSGYQTWLAAGLEKELSPRFRISAGMISSTGRMQYPAFHQGESSWQTQSLPFNSIGGFVKGSYQLHSKLLIHGDYRYSVIRPIAPASFSTESGKIESFGLGVEYRLSEKTSIGVEVRQNRFSGMGIPVSPHQSSGFGPSGIYPYGW